MATFQVALNNDEEWAMEIGKPAGDEGEEPGESGAPGYLQGAWLVLNTDLQSTRISRSSVAMVSQPFA
eukprot:3753898-Pyramimonas_sp.AAC.1